MELADELPRYAGLTAGNSPVSVGPQRGKGPD